MEKKSPCTECNINECIDNNILFCLQCVNNNLTTDMCERLAMFIVKTNNTSLCICGKKAAKNCILQCCKKCCVVKNCVLHSEKSTQFCFNRCTLCDTYKEKLNTYYIQNICKNQLISYCEECYIKNKKKNNLLIFNNTNVAQRKKLNISVGENNSEKKERKAINSKSKDKMIDIQLQKAKINEIKKKFQIIKSSAKDGTFDDFLLKTHINLIDNYMIDVLENVIMFECTCGNMSNFENVYQCKHCDLYKCEDCTFSCITVCSDKKCNYLDNLCVKSLFKCKSCVNYKINIFTKNNINVKITSSLLNTAEIDIQDFDDNLCDNIFNCDICKEDVNFTYTKISKCDQCNNFYCNKCGIFKKTYTVLFDNIDIDNDYDELKFMCNNCLKTDKTINENNDEITIKSKSFIKFESDVKATSKDEECAVCYTNKKIYACIPCGHLCLCYKCKNSIKDKCPMCNEEFDEIFKIYA